MHSKTTEIHFLAQFLVWSGISSHVCPCYMDVPHDQGTCLLVWTKAVTKPLNSVEHCQNILGLSHMCLTITFCCHLVRDIGLLPVFCGPPYIHLCPVGLWPAIKRLLVQCLFLTVQEDEKPKILILFNLFLVTFKQVSFHPVLSHILERDTLSLPLYNVLTSRQVLHLNRFAGLIVSW